jgi:hypothetical protein
MEERVPKNVHDTTDRFSGLTTRQHDGESVGVEVIDHLRLIRIRLERHDPLVQTDDLAVLATKVDGIFHTLLVLANFLRSELSFHPIAFDLNITKVGVSFIVYLIGHNS